MKSLIHTAKIPGLVLGIFVISTWLLTSARPQPWQAEERFVAPPQNLRHLHFGFNEVMADLFWLRAIQDFDYCENQLAQNLCAGKGWLFRTLDLVTDLSPQFRMPLATGPLALSVIISDIEGASLLFDKAVKRFPQDWKIAYRASYHALYEEKNETKAAALLLQAGQHGAPQWVYSLAARLYSENGRRDLALGILAGTEGLPEDLRERIRLKINQSR